MPQRIEVDNSGRKRFIELTAEEIEQARVNTEVENQDRASRPPSLEERVAELERRVGVDNRGRDA